MCQLLSLILSSHADTIYCTCIIIYMYCEEGNGVFCIDVIILIVETSCLDPPSTYLLSFPQVVYLIINLSTFYCLFLNLNYGASPLLFLLSLSLFLPPFLSPFSPLPLSLFPFSSLSLYLIPSPPLLSLLYSSQVY